jgi:hypothetical protein
VLRRLIADRIQERCAGVNRIEGGRRAKRVKSEKTAEYDYEYE